MDTSLTGLIRTFVPKIPLILRTTVAHALGLSDTSSEWDLRTELMVKIIRSFLNVKRLGPMGRSQQRSLLGTEIAGPMWIAKTTLEKPEESDVRETFCRAFDGLKDGAEDFVLPEVQAVEGEWTGFRAGVEANAPPLAIPEEEKYKCLMNEVGSKVTVLYFHGGAYYLMDPATHRTTTTLLAKLTKGRCFSVRYRLAPQNPFPAALLDALVAYLSLLYPGPNALHAAVPASDIVFSGDSAGGGLCMALLQLLLELHRQPTPPVMRWFERDVPIPLPAGVAVLGGWLDTTHCFPSIQTNAKYDYFPDLAYASPSRYAPDDVWPTNPPRSNIYANDSCLFHPLVSPITSPSWTHSPPLLFLIGQELLADENRYLASQAASSPSPAPVVILHEYQAMPHCFAPIFSNLQTHRLAASKHCFESWAAFLTNCVVAPPPPHSQATTFAPKTLAPTPLEVTKLSPFTKDDVRARMTMVLQANRRLYPLAGAGAGAGAGTTARPQKQEEGQGQEENRSSEIQGKEAGVLAMDAGRVLVGS